MRKSILIFQDFILDAKDLPEQDKANILDFIIAFLEKDTKTLESFTKNGVQGMFYKQLERSLQESSEKYNAKIETSRQNGMKGGRPKKQVLKPTESLPELEVAPIPKIKSKKTNVLNIDTFTEALESFANVFSLKPRQEYYLALFDSIAHEFNDLKHLKQALKFVENLELYGKMPNSSHFKLFLQQNSKIKSQRELEVLQELEEKQKKEKIVSEKNALVLPMLYKIKFQTEFTEREKLIYKRALEQPEFQKLMDSNNFRFGNDNQILNYLYEGYNKVLEFEQVF